MSSWFSNLYQQPINNNNINNDKIANLHYTITNLETKINRLVLQNNKLNVDYNVLRNEHNMLEHKYNSLEAYLLKKNVFNHQYETLFKGMLYMTTTQLNCATTNIDKFEYKHRSGANTMNKHDLMYCVLFTICRKSVDDFDNRFTFLLDERHKLTVDCRNYLTDNINDSKHEWNEFRKGYVQNKTNFY